MLIRPVVFFIKSQTDKRPWWRWWWLQVQSEYGALQLRSFMTLLNHCLLCALIFCIVLLSWMVLIFILIISKRPVQRNSVYPGFKAPSPYETWSTPNKLDIWDLPIPEGLHVCCCVTLWSLLLSLKWALLTAAEVKQRLSIKTAPSTKTSIHQDTSFVFSSCPWSNRQFQFWSKERYWRRCPTKFKVVPTWIKVCLFKLTSSSSTRVLPVSHPTHSDILRSSYYRAGSKNNRAVVLDICVLTDSPINPSLTDKSWNYW